MNLTKTGWAFIGLGALIYLASMQGTTGLLFLVLGVIFGCLVYNVARGWSGLNALDILPPASLHGTEGERLRESWRVKNGSASIAGLAEVHSVGGMLLRIGFVGPRAEVRQRPSMVLPGRGVYPVSGLRLVSAFPFGLVSCERTLAGGVGEIVVYPAVYPCAAPRVAGFRPTLGGKMTGRYRSALGQHFHGVRPLRDGDSPRFIHWPSSAKGRGLMVKEFDEELSGRVSIVVDRRGGRTPDGERVLDWAARAAGSLALSALDEGNHVELTDLAGGPVHVFTPFTDPDAVLDALARLGERALAAQDATECVDGVLAECSGTSALCFVLTQPDADVLSAVAARSAMERRPVSLYVPEFSPSLSDAAVLPPCHRYSGGAILE